MTLERAQAVARELQQSDPDDVRLPFTDTVLEAAALLKRDDLPTYQELYHWVRESAANANDWRSAAKDALRDVTRKTRRNATSRKTIVDGAELHRVVEESCEALGQLDVLYERAGELVEVLPDPQRGARLRALPKPRIREYLSMAARFERHNKDGSVRDIKPPHDVVDSVHARGEWGLQRFDGFVDGAAFAQNGDIIAQEGYNPEHALYVRRAVEVFGLQRPSQQDAAAACERLCGLLHDFEFVEENRRAQMSAWVACVLTIIARHAIGEGATPMFLFDANQPRVGKTRLGELACMIVTGREPGKQALPTGRHSDKEIENVITGAVRGGQPIIFFDNVKGRLGGQALEGAMTTAEWTGRILGKSEMFTGPLRTIWIATSNNASLTSDMLGRVLPIQLQTTHQNPEQRTGFLFPRIKAHVREHRASYLKDALTILRAWHVADRPSYDITSWGSFEAWGDIVRNALIFAGMPDPCDTRDSIEEADDFTLAQRMLIEVWPDGKGYSASELAKIMRGSELNLTPVEQTFSEALNEFCEQATPRGIGRQLGYVRDRVLDAKRITQRRTTQRREWLVEDV